MKKNLLITTGGSGGHVVPAITLFEHLSKQNNVFISIDKRGLEYLDKDKYQFEIIDTPKLNNIFFCFNKKIDFKVKYKILMRLKGKKRMLLSFGVSTISY